MILSCHNIEKSFNDHTILKKASFHIEEREKASIVGVNGAGKTTLLRILIGELEADSGNVVLAKGKTLGYLSQHQELSTSDSIYDTLLAVKGYLLTIEKEIRALETKMHNATGSHLESLLEQYDKLNLQYEQENGYAYRSEVTGILKGLGFLESEFEKPVSTLSGGQKTRVSLGRLLLQNPDIIILDEPTNHLDLSSITWLENYLLNYAGSVLIVSHDRYFLDKIVSKIIEIEHGNVAVYSGNYSTYSVKKKAAFEAIVKQYVKQQQEIKHQEEVITKLKSFNREKSIKQAESREKALQRIDLIEKPIGEDKTFHFELVPPVISGKDVLSVEGLSKSFGAQTLFTNLHFEIKRGEHVAIVGNNGTGKTTLLKILNQIHQADDGIFKLGSNVCIAYYDQEHHVLHDESTLFDEISDAYPSMSNTEIRNVLAAFLFTGDDVYKQIKFLSGGEKGRLSLAKLMLSKANLLILDEPTNHLDIMSKEILEQAINRYTGTVLYVSHDRFFINQTATRILELTSQTFLNYIGNYDYYLEKKELLSASLLPTPTATTTEEETLTKNDWEMQKELQAKKRKQQNDLAKCENEIAKHEASIQAIEEEMLLPDVCTNASKLLQLQNEKEALESTLERFYEQWETLAE